MPPKKRTRPSTSASPAAAVETPRKSTSRPTDDAASTPKRAHVEGASPTPRVSAVLSTSSSAKKGGKSRSASKGASPSPKKRATPLKNLNSGSDEELDVLDRPTTATTAVPAAAATAAAAHPGNDAVEAAAFVPTNTVRDLESLVVRSKVIAPDVSGISCIAANSAETEVVVARENGSLVLYSVEYFQGIPHFTQIRATGGRVRRTITRVAFLDLSGTTGDDDDNDDGSRNGNSEPLRDRFFAASYLSGQLVIYDAETLFPVAVSQRTGGAIWDFAVADAGRTIYAALADGSFHQLQVSISRSTRRPVVELSRIIPRIAGADRAFSVTVDAALGIVVGTDDAGNVHAWRHAARTSGGLSAHESLWTCRLPKGMPMCCTVADSTRGGKGRAGAPSQPVVAVGTSMGDVVFIDGRHGRILHTFTTHNGPVSTITADAGAVYASGWHESLRCFRYAAGKGGDDGDDGAWFPAEVKRRTHYHEAAQLLVLPQRQLMLSASRDGTIMFAPVAKLFSDPAMYVQVTTQRFAFAAEKNVLLQTRLGRVEAFRTDASLRHWSPLFAHNIHGKYHPTGLWCDPALHYIVFATDERVVVGKTGWRDGAESALAITRIEEVLELPASRGLLDVVFVAPAANRAATATTRGSSSGSNSNGANEEETEAAGTTTAGGALYLLFDGYVLYVTLADGYPVIRTDLPPTRGDADDKSGATTSIIRPHRLLHTPSRRGKAPKSAGGAASLTVLGLRGSWRCELTADGTPDPDTAHVEHGASAVFTHAATVPALAGAHAPQTTIGLNKADGRYTVITGAGEAQPQAFPPTLPHDVTFVAQLPRAAAAAGGADAVNYVGHFSKGLVFVGPKEWRMAARMNVEAAFVTKDGRRVLVLERNLEKMLEALPLCWKVRRFGN